MLMKSNRDEVLKSLKNGKLLDIIPLYPSIADEIVIDADKKYHIIQLFNQVFPNKNNHYDAMKPSVFLTLGVLSMLNNFHALSSFPIATSSPYILEKLNLIISPDNGKPYFNEKNVRNFSKKYPDEEFQTCLNEFLRQLFALTNYRHMHVYSYDCSDIPVCFDNDHYERSEIITGKDGNRIRGYKLGVLRGILPQDESYPCEIKFGSLKQHDLSFSKDLLLKTQWLMPKDTLLIDRGFLDHGFLDHHLLRELNEKNVTVIVPAKKNMEIFQNAVEIAKNEGKWLKHPNPKRKHQSIQLVKDLEMYWQGDKEKEKNCKKELKLSAVVIRYDLKKGEVDCDGKSISKDKQYAYSVLLCTNPELKAREIVQFYEMRWGSEEDFRQLKDYWGMANFTTTRYEGILLELICCISAYALYELYKLTAKGKKLRNHCLMRYYQSNEQKWQSGKDATYVILVNGYYSIFKLMEVLKLYRQADERVCKAIDHVLDR